MEFWRTILETPSEEKSMNDFAQAIHKIPKVVFSHTLTNVDWDKCPTLKLAYINNLFKFIDLFKTETIKEEVEDCYLF